MGCGSVEGNGCGDVDEVIGVLHVLDCEGEGLVGDASECKGGAGGGEVEVLD